MQHIEQEIETHHELQSAGATVIPRFELCVKVSRVQRKISTKPFIDSDGACLQAYMWICANDLTENGKIMFSLNQ